MNRELMQQALDALMGCAAGSQKTLEMKMEAVAAIRAALDEPAPEPNGECVRLQGYSCGKCGCVDMVRDDAAPPAAAEPVVEFTRTEHGIAYSVTAPPAAVPPGYVLVPVEPTEKMLLAYTKCYTDHGFRWARHQWSEMLAARPGASDET